MGHPHKEKELQSVFAVCGLLMLIVFVALVLAVLFVLDDKARHIADKQKDLIKVINNSGGQQGRRRRAVDIVASGLVEREHNLGDTTNTQNTYISNSYHVLDNNPQDSLINSVYSNGHPCYFPPPIDALPSTGFFNHTFMILEREWQRLGSDASLPGFAIGVVYDNSVIYKRAFGVTDHSTNQTLTPSTLFRIGGLTRLFTAFLAFQQRDQNALKFEDPLKSLLPGLQITNPFNAREDFTIRSVLTELSGLPRSGPPDCEPFRCNFTTAEILQKIADAQMQLINPPYLLPSRSDLGWSLLGRGMESLSGFGTYEQQIQTAITSVLGMPDTVFVPSAAQQSRVSPGHVGSMEITSYELGWNRPWGGLYSTLDDMIELLTALNQLDAPTNETAKLLKSQSLRELMLPAFMNPDSKSGQGSPFQMLYFQNKLMRTLGGSVNGYSSHLIAIPGLRLSMIVLANSGNVDVSPFTLEAARLLIPLIQNQLLKEEQGPQPAMNATQFTTSYIGVNSRGQTGTLTVEADENGVLSVYDSRLTATTPGLQYKLSYVGSQTNNTAERFKVSIAASDSEGQAYLTCLNIVNSGAENEFMDFSDFGQEHYRVLLFQGRQYHKASSDLP